MWEGWSKNLALLFPAPRRLALVRFLEFAVLAACVTLAGLKWAVGEPKSALLGLALAILFAGAFLRRIRLAHFDWLSSVLAFFGLPLFAILLLNSDISHKRGLVPWKGRRYRVLPSRGNGAQGIAPPAEAGSGKKEGAGTLA